MAEPEQKEKVPSLAEQWILLEKVDQADHGITLEQETRKANGAAVALGEIVVEKIDKAPVAKENAHTTGENSETPKLDVELTEVEEKKIGKEKTPISNENSVTPEQKIEQSYEAEGKQEPMENAPATENSENRIPEEYQVQEVEEKEEAKEESPKIKLETAPADFRFPTTNQTRHCFTRYIEYHRCIDSKGEGAPECQKFAKYYRSLCPGEWIERWNEQRENGTFPGPL